jgi:glycine/D-amino acid oxidase-like deaminating enzyme
LKGLNMTLSQILHQDFKEEPYWWEAARPVAQQDAVGASVDVAIVGGGYGGLSAALHLASKGVSVAVFEAQDFGHGSSSRNAGMVSAGTYIFKDVKNLPKQEATAIIAEASEALRFVETLIHDHGIDCDYQRSGRIIAAASPRHFDAMAAGLGEMNTIARADAYMLPAAEIRSEIGSDAYWGATIIRNAAKFHPALYYHGLLRAAAAAGAKLRSSSRVTSIERRNGQFELRFSDGAVTAGQVVIATNGETSELTPFLRRRVVPVGSYMLATEPLPVELRKALFPNGRTMIDSRNVMRFARCSPDGERLMFGGRAKFSSHPARDAVAILHGFMIDVFPQLAGYRISHAWMGNVAFTFDRLSHAGVHDGLHFCLGCNGSGVSMMTLLGRRLAERILGAETAGPLERPDFPTRPFYNGDPTLGLMAVGASFKFKDWMERLRTPGSSRRSGGR